MPRPLRIWLLFLVLGGAFLRWPGLFHNSFHADEALFASWARLIAVWRDPLLQTILLDKPPLLFYLQALFYPLFGPVEWAARWPNLIASILLIPLLAQWVWRLYRDETAALLAAAFVAVSPLAIQFSATAFLDPLLVTMLAASLWLFSLARNERPDRFAKPVRSAVRSAPYPFLAGLLWGLALAVKYQALLYLPLLAGLALLAGWRWAEVRRWLAGCVPVLLLLIIWEAARTGGFTLWAEQMGHYGGLRLAWSWELWSRWQGWAALWGLALGADWLPAALLVLLALFGWRTVSRPYAGSQLDQLFLLFLAGYLLLHWFLAIPIWDRYLLPALPILALLIARAAGRLPAFLCSDRVSIELNRRVRRERRENRRALRLAAASFRRFLAATPAILAQAGFILLCLALFIPPALQARQGAPPLGGQPAADNGAAEIAAFLSDKPYGTVLYDHWYSWHWRYHLFDSGVYVSWFPHPDALVEDLRVFGRSPGERYLVLPAGPEVRPVKRVVTAAGFQLTPLLDAGGMRLWLILPYPAAETPP